MRSPRPRAPWHDLVRAARWHRRGLAAVAAACAVLLALSALSPRQPATTPVVVAAHALPPGAALRDADLRVARYPEGLAPASALRELPEARGRVLACGMAQDGVITTESLLATSTAAAPGEQLVPVRVADQAVLSLVRVGDRVTVVATGNDQQVVTLAQRVRVVTLPQQESAGLTAGTDAPGGLLVVSAPPGTATRLAAWAGPAGVGLVLG